MKLLSALALAASLSSAASAAVADENDYKHARVVPGVVPDDSIVKLHEHVGTLRLLRKTAGDGKNRKYGEAAVQPEDLRRILASVGDDREVREAKTLRSTLITGDTEPHKDMKVGGDGVFDDDEEVMFVFLNDNEGAYFRIGEDKVPAKAGTLVSFKGNKMVHNTVVPSGSEVRLLGPIASRDLQNVSGHPLSCSDFCDAPGCAAFDPGAGCRCESLEIDECGPCVLVCDTPAPTSSPTKNPTESPTKSPTESPTKNPAIQETAAPTVQGKSGKSTAGKAGKPTGKSGKAAAIGNAGFLLDGGSMSASMSMDLEEEDITFFGRRG